MFREVGCSPCGDDSRTFEDCHIGHVVGETCHDSSYSCIQGTELVRRFARRADHWEEVYDYKPSGWFDG